MPMAPNSAKEAAANQAALTTQLNDFLTKVDSLRPTVSDQAVFDSLVAVVQASTQKNESVAAFVTRVEAAGKAVAGLARTLGLMV